MICSICSREFAAIIAPRLQGDGDGPVRCPQCALRISSIFLDALRAVYEELQASSAAAPPSTQPPATAPSRNCEVCGGAFEAKRRDARYCSARCRQAARRRGANVLNERGGVR